MLPGTDPIEAIDRDITPPMLGEELGATPAERRRAGSILYGFVGVALGVLAVALLLAVLGRYLAAILAAIR